VLGGITFPWAPFQGVRAEEAFGQLHIDDGSLRNIINPAPSTTDPSYTILQPGNSILKNMYILVRNNNFSVTQSFGNGSTGSGLRNYDLDESNVPNVYDEIGLRLNVSIGEESSDITQNNFLEERDLGGDIVIVPGNYADTSANDGGDYDQGATATEISGFETTAMPPNRRPAAAGKRQMFRHNGVLLGKDTLIPIITNYTFSSAQEKLHCINQNGYSGNYEDIFMDDIRMARDNGITASLYNSSPTERKLHVVIDASTSTLPPPGAPQDGFANTAKTGKLTGADFTYLPNSLTQPRDIDEDKTYTYDPNGPNNYFMQEYPHFPFNSSNNSFSMNRESISDDTIARDSKIGFASNLLRDNVYNSKILKDTNNGICTGLPANQAQSDYLGNSTLDFDDNVDFKIICDFQHLN
jgi:hypothetical protein